MKILLGEAMRKKDITYEQLADLSGISKSTLQRIATEKTSPTLDTMEWIAIGLGMKICDLFDSDYK